IRMRVIPADHVQSLLARRLLRINHVLRRHRKAIARRIVTAIDHREKSANFAWLVFAKQCAAAFMRTGFCAVCADFVREFLADCENRSSHVYSSSQNRSLKYFDALSAKTVTIFARSPGASDLATSMQPTSAAAALGLTSKPSSRASRFTIR